MMLFIAIACDGQDLDADGDGYSTRAGDCDDSDAAVHPRAVDLVGDGLDADCDGSDAAGDRLEAPTATGALAGLEFGTEILTVDMEGDGATEVVVGAPHNASSGVDQTLLPGSIFLLAGAGLSITDTASEAGELLGVAVAAGDVTGDDRPDVLAWILTPDRILVYSGGDLGAATTIERGDDYAINPYLLAADVSGDGVDDTVISAVDYSDDNAAEAAIHILFGPLPLSPSVATPSVRLTSDTLTSVGQGVAAFDLDGDGFHDLSLGTPDADLNTGRVDVHLGPVETNGTVEGGSMSWRGSEQGDWFGIELARAGDLDGDGADDLAVGAIGWPGGDRFGRVSILAADTPDAEGAIATIEGEGPSQHLGRAMIAGDLDVDGIDDLVVGAPSLTSLDASQPGRVAVFFGPVSGQLTSADAALAWTGSAPGDMAGSALAIGDQDGDGSDDLLIGAPGCDAAAENGGCVYQFLGPLVD